MSSVLLQADLETLKDILRSGVPLSTHTARELIDDLESARAEIAELRGEPSPLPRSAEPLSVAEMQAALDCHIQ